MPRHVSNRSSAPNNPGDLSANTRDASDLASACPQSGLNDGQVITDIRALFRPQSKSMVPSNGVRDAAEQIELECLQYFSIKT